MTKSITDIAREAGASAYTNRHYPDQPYLTFSPEKLEAFAAAIKAAHLAELSGVEMPEPVAWYVTTENQDGTRSTYPLSGRYKDVRDACDFGEPVPLVTLDQLQQAVAAAVARHKQDWNRFHHLMKKHGLHPGRTDDDLLEILDKDMEASKVGLHHIRENNVSLRKERDALTTKRDAAHKKAAEAIAFKWKAEAERDRLIAEHKQDSELLDEIGKLLEPVKYEGSYAEGLRVLIAERDALAKKVEVLREALIAMTESDDRDSAWNAALAALEASK